MGRGGSNFPRELKGFSVELLPELREARAFNFSGPIALSNLGSCRAEISPPGFHTSLALQISIVLKCDEFGRPANATCASLSCTL